MLHVGPEQCFSKLLGNNNVIDYVTLDLAPEAMVQADLTGLCFQKDTFDMVFASHVLEHILEDTKAMREIFRILKPDGWAILQVPIDMEREVTLEDSSI